MFDLRNAFAGIQDRFDLIMPPARMANLSRDYQVFLLG
jgi:hypothetical protein